MDRTPQLHDELHQQLAQEGLPRWYIDRLIREWSDHCNDLSAAGELRPHEHLGAIDDLADAAVTSFRSRTLLGRRPLVGFFGGPVLLATISWIGYFGFFFAMMAFTFESLGEARCEQLWLVQSIFLGGKVVPPMLSAGILTWLAGRSGQPFRWIVCSLTTLCLFCFFGPTTQWSLPSVSEPEGTLSLGFPFLFVDPWQALGQLVQATAAFATAGVAWMVIRRGISGGTPARVRVWT